MIVRLHVVASLALALLVGCSGSTSGTDDLLGDGGSTQSSGGGGGGGGGGLGSALGGSGGGGGGSGSGSANGANGSGTANGSSGSSTATGTSSSCQLQNLQLGTGACDQCLAKSCCTETKGCDGNAACISLFNCVAKCNDDEACGQQCVSNNQGGVSALKTLYTCLQNTCGTECQ
jgi:hypothetical protein